MKESDFSCVLQQSFTRTAITQGSNRLVLFKQIGNEWQKAVVKSTDDSKRLYLVSYHKTDAREVRRIRKQGQIARSVWYQ